MPSDDDDDNNAAASAAVATSVVVVAVLAAVGVVVVAGVVCAVLDGAISLVHSTKTTISHAASNETAFALLGGNQTAQTRERLRCAQTIGAVSVANLVCELQVRAKR